MFDAKGVVVVELTGVEKFRVHMDDGKFIDLPSFPAGATYWAPGGARIAVENTSDQRVEYLVVEPKTSCKN
jgi:hypothetical protein